MRCLLYSIDETLLTPIVQAHVDRSGYQAAAEEEKEAEEYGFGVTDYGLRITVRSLGGPILYSASN